MNLEYDTLVTVEDYLQATGIDLIILLHVLFME